MRILLSIAFKNSPNDFDDIDEELSPFEYCLQDLRRFIDHINSIITLDFGEGKKIMLDMFPDFSVCFEDIVESVMLAKNGNGNGYIWFCEQGADFYMNYTIKNDSIFIEFKKGMKVGLPNRKMDDFLVEVNRNEYVEEWQKVFKSISDLFGDKLNKKIDCPV